ncbi:hypothetical protein GCM10010350_51260 [Streptomyces galilaeus]|nr:hypothetical protein GCM10010350_51260 [Streptomyces galilaeus]
MRPPQDPYTLGRVGPRFQGHPGIGQVGLPAGDAAGDIVTPGVRSDNRLDQGHPKERIGERPAPRQAKFTSLT